MKCVADLVMACDEEQAECGYCNDHCPYIDCPCASVNLYLPFVDGLPVVISHTPKIMQPGIPMRVDLRRNIIFELQAKYGGP